MENTSQLITPYEQFLRQNLEADKRKAEQLALSYANARGIKKLTLKRDLDRLNRNIQILSNDLQKYNNGLEWLREPTKERDEKAEHLKPVPAEALAGPKAQAAPQQRTAAPQGSLGRPQIGTAVGAQNRPVIGQPRPAVAEPSSPAPQAVAPQPAAVQRPNPPPVANATGGRPRIGTPIGNQAPQPSAQPAPQSEAPAASEAPAQTQATTPEPSKRVMIGTPIGGRPRIGTPIAQKPSDLTDATEANQSQENSSS